MVAAFEWDRTLVCVRCHVGARARVFVCCGRIVSLDFVARPQTINHNASSVIANNHMARFFVEQCRASAVRRACATPNDAERRRATRSCSIRWSTRVC